MAVVTWPQYGRDVAYGTAAFVVAQPRRYQAEAKGVFGDGHLVFQILRGARPGPSSWLALRPEQGGCGVAWLGS